MWKIITGTTFIETIYGDNKSVKIFQRASDLASEMIEESAPIGFNNQENGVPLLHYYNSIELPRNL